MVKLSTLLVSTMSIFANSLQTQESQHVSSDLGTENVLDGVLVDQDGTAYDLSKLVPYYELLSPSRFTPLFDNEAKEMDLLTGEIFSMPISRAVFDDGAILQVEKDAGGIIVYAEIRHETGKPDTIFVKTEDCKDDELLTLTEDQLNDFSTLLEGSYFEDEEVVEFDPGFGETRVEADDPNLPDFFFERGDGTSSDCPYFKVVNIGIVYDAEFCTLYGGKDQARSRIMMIVAAASVLYENDMCVKLQLTDIYTPDDDCSSTSAFAPFPRDKACGSGNSETFIRYFREWMNANRQSIGLNPGAAFHAFTGLPHRGTLGCGYIGTVCQYPDYAYGVDYMSDVAGTAYSLSTQSIIFAHELGHNLSARHLTAKDAGSLNYVMRSSLSSARDGFSAISIDKIIGFLDSNAVTCDKISFPEPTNPPTQPPTILHSEQPSLRPSSAPTMHPSRPPSLFPTMAPSVPPSSSPSLASSSPPVTRCFMEQVPRSPVCIQESQDGLFGCFPTMSLMSVRPNQSCSLDQPFFASLAFVSCQEQQLEADGGSNDDGRSLRKKKKKKITKSETEFEDNEERVGDGDGDVIIPIKKISVAGSNDQGLDFFAAGDCSVGCTMIGDHVCFRSFLDDSSIDSKTYILSFTATSRGDSELFTMEISIERDDAVDKSCILPETICVD